ncbi:hypothetical protein JAMGFMIE_03980 [Rheinheimera sp. MM224]|nr:hypothetical protein JAMGFMIE_03980 [Rheinheimera sp. MM224]
MQQTKQILVIGNGMVGHHFFDQLRAKDPVAPVQSSWC